METLNAKVRDMADKPKKLRREGRVTGSISGRELEHSISITLSEQEASQFLKKNYVGSQVTLDLDGTKYRAMVKSVDYHPLEHRVLDMTFQQLVAGEKVRAVAEIVLVNEELAKGFITRNETEVVYRTFPRFLVDKIELDVSKYPIGTNLTVADLELAKNPDVEMETPMDANILHVAEHKHLSQAEQEDIAAEQAAAQAAGTTNA